jgi:hypothetical protein
MTARAADLVAARLAEQQREREVGLDVREPLSGLAGHPVKDHGDGTPDENPRFTGRLVSLRQEPVSLLQEPASLLKDDQVVAVDYFALVLGA